MQLSRLGAAEECQPALCQAAGSHFESLPAEAVDHHGYCIGSSAHGRGWVCGAHGHLPGSARGLSPDCPPGENTRASHDLGSRFVLAASVVLALGLATDLPVVNAMITGPCGAAWLRDLGRLFGVFCSGT